MTTGTRHPPRHIDHRALRPPQKGVCRWCGGKVGRGRRTWCSQKCVDDYRIRAEPSYASHLVGKRDGGICRACGMDTCKLERTLWSLFDRPMWSMKRDRYSTKSDRAIREIARWALERMGFGKVAWPRKLWERDHIVAVVEGGGGCGLDNYQTLCIPCHRAKTGSMRTRLAGKTP